MGTAANRIDVPASRIETTDLASTGMSTAARQPDEFGEVARLAKTHTIEYGNPSVAAPKSDLRAAPSVKYATGIEHFKKKLLGEA